MLYDPNFLAGTPPRSLPGMSRVLEREADRVAVMLANGSHAALSGAPDGGWLRILDGALVKLNPGDELEFVRGRDAFRAMVT